MHVPVYICVYILYEMRCPKQEMNTLLSEEAGCWLRLRLGRLFKSGHCPRASAAGCIAIQELNFLTF